MSREVKCILIEDEQPAIEIFQSFAARFQDLKVQGIFNDVLTARTFLKDHEIDVIFLDIQLPGMTGMEFLESMNPSCKIVICSAYEQHAIKAYEFEVFDYLLKPYSLSRFTKCIGRLEKEFYDNSNTEKPLENLITIKSGLNYFKLKLDDILFIESDNEYVVFNTNDDRKIISRMTMSEVQNLTSKNEFIRVHRSFIVNSQFLDHIESKYLIISGIKIPIGRTYSQIVKEYFKL